MRSILAGLLVLTLTSAAWAQASGQVLSIGFADHFRNDCWPPMLVQIIPESSENLDLEIRVSSRDLDGDDVFYVKRINLTKRTEGQSPPVQSFWMYFLPQPVNHGLPSRPDPLKDLKDQLKVGLYAPGLSGKFIAPLPLTSMITDVNRLNNARETQFILSVSDGGSNLTGMQDYGIARGILQDVCVVPVRPHDLPESELGYQAVDAVLWANATPLDSSLAADEHRMRALQNYVRQGGHLVILQTLQWEQTDAALGPMLPVIVKAMADRTNVDLLRRLANPNPDKEKNQLREWDPNRLAGPFKIARALPKPTAIVEEWLDWQTPDGQTTRTPYIARQRFGLGAVTWVAQDLGDPMVARPYRNGWPHVWDRVFDWKNETYVPKAGEAPMRKNEPYPTANAPATLGGDVPTGTDFASKISGLIFLAIIFFIFYWIAAGPGSYLLLAGRKRTALSWFAYALSALGATGLTVLIVHFVLRGPPQIKHITLVRTTPGEPAVVDVRLGLYIPRDGDQVITMKNGASGSLSHIEPYGPPPKYAEDTGFTARMDYRVPVRDLGSAGDPTLTVPYRSSLKKFQARWVGEVGGITGQAKLLTNRPYLDGKVTNETGHPLTDVYLVFKRFHAAVGRAGNIISDDQVVYIPGTWFDGKTLDLQENERGNSKGKALLVGRSGTGSEARPGGERVIDDTIVGPSATFGWAYYWTSFLRTNSYVPDDKKADKLSDPGGFSFPMISLFGRLPPVKSIDKEAGRVELLRGGTRYMDISPAVAAGSLVVLARTETEWPTPIPLAVNGDPATGGGLILYQAVIPLDRSLEQSALQPATLPAEATN